MKFKKVVCIVLCLIMYHVTSTTFRFRCGLWPAASLSWSDCPAFRGGVHLQRARPRHRQDRQCWAQLHLPAAAAAIRPSFKVSANHNVEEIKILCVCVWFYCSRQSVHRQEADILYFCVVSSEKNDSFSLKCWPEDPLNQISQLTKGASVSSVLFSLFIHSFFNWKPLLQTAALLALFPGICLCAPLFDHASVI